MFAAKPAGGGLLASSAAPVSADKDAKPPAATGLFAAKPPSAGLFGSSAAPAAPEKDAKPNAALGSAGGLFGNKSAGAVGESGSAKDDKKEDDAKPPAGGMFAAKPPGGGLFASSAGAG